VRWTPEGEPRGFNIIGDLPGTDKADEIVLIGAHFDSFHGATGATDNAAGVAAMMEAVRILKTLGLAPRRTIRIGLWGDEEGGTVGSETYVTQHLGSRANPTPARAKLSVYFNLDNGTGRIRGIWSQRNASAQRIFEAWSVPLRDLGVDLISPRWVTQTDHQPFEDAGIPAFQFVQERYEYGSRTHHTNMDFLDRVQVEDVKQMAAVVAVFAWHAATRDALMPRVP
jgi:carboxypeptidase Q